MKLSPNFTLEELTRTYRSARLNAHVGGVPNSYHLQGLAADIHVDSEEDARRKFEILRNNPAVDSVLFEHAKSGSRWLHVQTKRIVQPRRLANFNYRVKEETHPQPLPRGVGSK